VQIENYGEINVWLVLHNNVCVLNIVFEGKHLLKLSASDTHTYIKNTEG